MCYAGESKKIILAEFEKLEGPHACSILGMYGLPGSGKSTLCRYLIDYLSCEFSGKVLYLELPTDANDEELLNSAKNLLKKLTNFSNKMGLGDISSIRQVYHLLKGTDFLRSRVFLIVDNISSQKSVNAVKHVLSLGLGVGSKVLLVARTINVLRPLLQHDGSQENNHYVYGMMSAPGLNEGEALEVLLQKSGGVAGRTGSYSASLSSSHRQIMEEVVRMSSFVGDDGRALHLPLVLEIMGQQLQEQQLDVYNWKGTMERLWIGSGLCKEEALKQLVLESFRALPSRLQVLFLDVALFILPLSYKDGASFELDRAWLCLGVLNSLQQEEAEFEVHKLQKHCFLTIRSSPSIITVHDVYLQFAACIDEASLYYWSSGHRWRKVQHDVQRPIEMASKAELRTLVLELADDGVS